MHTVSALCQSWEDVVISCQPFCAEESEIDLMSLLLLLCFLALLSPLVLAFHVTITLTFAPLV